MKSLIPLSLSSFIVSNVQKVEESMLKLDQADCPVYHHFYPGIYMREVHIKAGVFSIGHYQKTKHLNIMIKGEVNFIHDDGHATILKAPMIFMSDPGRKIGLILKDMVWINVYPTDETDIEVLEKTYLDKSDTWKSVQPKKNVTDDKKDFEEMLKEYNITIDKVRSESERTDDLIPFPDGIISVGVFDSPIEGKGLFAMADIKNGEIIATGRIGNYRTPADRYVNHSKTPTATVVNSLHGIDFIAIKNISGCKGGSLGDEITIDYRASIKLRGAK